MENVPTVASASGFSRRLIRGWLAITRRKIRTLQAGEITTAVPVLFAASHKAGFFQALVLSMAFDRPVHCLLSKNLVRGPVAEFLARHMGMILYEGDEPVSEATLREAVDFLKSGAAVLVFADQNALGQSAPGTLARTAALVLGRAEAQPAGRRIAVYPVHIFLPESAPRLREILIYVDSVMGPREDWRAARSPEIESPAFITALESRFQENAFQLLPADLEYFLTDLERVLQIALQEDWASRTEWKQDTEGFVLSRLVIEWAMQTNFMEPGRLVTLRKSLDDYNRLQQQCALRELEVDVGNSPLGSGWRRGVIWFETLLGLPLALYGLLNHLLIGLVLILSGSFRSNGPRDHSAELKIRVAVTLGFYALQVFLVAHWRGRVAAGYYAPTLPVSGWYLWKRYAPLVRPQARLLFISLTIPALKRKISRLRHILVSELDQTLSSYEQSTSLPR